MRQRLWRIWCNLWGCVCHEHGWYCTKCGRVLYDDFVSAGSLSWLQFAYWEAKAWVIKACRGKYCAECGKKMDRWGDWHDTCCSDECYQNHIPF